jgi:hypothetical protein
MWEERKVKGRGGGGVTGENGVIEQRDLKGQCRLNSDLAVQSVWLT